MIILNIISKIKFIFKYFLIKILYIGLLTLMESKIMPIIIINQ